MDDFDRKILSQLQENSRQTAEAISETVGLSPTACQRRIKKLRDEGYIEKEIALLSKKATEGHMTFIVSVVLAKHGPDRVDRFKDHIRAFPEVQQGFYVTGEHDFILIVTARDMNHFDALSTKIFFNSDYVERFHTTVTFSTVKQSLTVPIR